MAMAVTIVTLSLTLSMSCNRHDLSLPTYGLQHEKQLFQIMIPRKRLEKKNLC